MRSTSYPLGHALTLGIAFACGSSLALAADPPVAPADAPDLTGATHPERLPYGVDFVALGDPVTGELRRLLEGFTHEIEGDTQRFTQVAFDRDEKHTIKLTVETTRASAAQEPTVFRVTRRVTLAWPSVTAHELMADARNRHGGKPTCESFKREAPFGTGTAQTVAAFVRGGLFGQPSDTHADGVASDTGNTCLWGAAELVDHGKVTCDGACLTATVVYPTPSKKLLRIDELAYDPSRNPAGHKISK
ncbi:hypothetical protein J7355_17075 [Endozoicomonas sp. G2_2]|uniref:hypothetical protein n=1 Tax=Endozoicomonas sp. G2_2 TaxID=2821092 RepID=UPI001ADA6250|nr:hypothetical protein [Endozoicomonas sp. G2_2]MBO9471807.1 hypothetical protein [Endozoicomonas sp. G2_2]